MGKANGSCVAMGCNGFALELLMDDHGRWCWQSDLFKLVFGRLQPGSGVEGAMQCALDRGTASGHIRPCANLMKHAHKDRKTA